MLTIDEWDRKFIPERLADNALGSRKRLRQFKSQGLM